MTAFVLPALSIPRNTLRRSYVAGYLRDYAYGHAWLTLLSKLAPEKAAGLQAHKAMECYSALCDYCETLFPMFEPDFEMWDLVEEEGATLAWLAWRHGIPVDVMGIDTEDAYYGNLNPAFMLCRLFDGEENFEFVVNQYDLLKPLRSKLKWFVEHGFEPSFDDPGRGRQWREPWGAIKLLVRYSVNGTDIGMLDWSHFAIAETGGNYPEWNINEIRGLAREWKRGKPLWEKIRRLSDHIEAQPEERLLQLAQLLAGHEPTIAQLTEPKPKKGKTLAEIFS